MRRQDNTMSDNRKKLTALKSSLATQPDRLPTVQPGSWRTQNQTSTQRGYGYAWQKARAEHLYNNPVCVMCDAEGIVRIATVVDHIDPHRGNMDVFWDMARWRSLCKPHHDSDSQKKDNAFDRRS
jgi:5-methylcytosine-specific restriction protein A